MRKRIAVITGASGGLGKEFVRQIVKEPVDEIWAVARNEERLKRLQREFGSRIRPMAKDLSVPEQVRSLGKQLEQEKPVVVYLVNNAGVGSMKAFRGFSVSELEDIVALNSMAMAVLCHYCLPYMRRGSRILNVASQASFQPLPYMSMYAATKTFARSFTRALNQELRQSGITATAVCPGWIDTELLRQFNRNNRICLPGVSGAGPVAKRAMRDAGRGRDMSVYSCPVRLQHVLAKLLPQRMVMAFWKEYIDRQNGGKK